MAVKPYKHVAVKCPASLGLYSSVVTNASAKKAFVGLAVAKNNGDESGYNGMKELRTRGGVRCYKQSPLPSGEFLADRGIFEVDIMACVESDERMVDVGGVDCYEECRCSEEVDKCAYFVSES